MAKEADIIISWFSSGASVIPALSRPTRVIQLPTPAGQKYKAQIAAFGDTPILNIVKQYAPDVRPLRVALLGFSEGCQGVRAMLSSPDGGRIDAAFAIDGIHAQYQPGSKSKIVPAYVTPWGAFAQRAAQGRTLLAITASSIKPPGFVSTTETAAWIWKYATGSTADQATSGIPEALLAPFNPPAAYKAGASGDLTWPATTYDAPPVSKFRRDHGLVIVNYKNLDATGHNDHVFQAQHVLPTMLQTYLADRWNSIEPRGGICVLSATEFDEPQAAGCFPPSALTDLYVGGNADAKPLDIPLDSEIDPTIPGTLDENTYVPAEPQQPSQFITFLKWSGGILGAAAVLEGGRRIAVAFSKDS